MKKENLDRTTIKTIAKAAGVSHTTVSRALNDSSLVKPQTKLKIKRLADEMGYIPDINAKGLVSNKAYVVGIYFSRLQSGTSSNFLAESIRQVKKLLADYTLAINGIDLMPNENAMLRNGKPDGALFISQCENDDSYIQHMRDNGVPVVVINRKTKVAGVTNVIPDEYHGVFQAIEYAIRLGHKKFGLIKGTPKFTSTHYREQGFRDAIAKHPEAKVVEQAVIDGNYSRESGFHAMNKILMNSEFPSLVFCSNDETAAGAIKSCQKFGLQVPTDISLMGFDNADYAKFMVPGLTTIYKPVDEITRIGVEQLKDLMEGNSKSDQALKKIVTTELIIRDSVADLR
ncbi:MAG: LacI family DNA-binding transcriptional regulator [Liquorilactobacillus ghanensis]|uniref:LacI family DNA-binding transcriptional regulator n=3 Tax=Liquorilactobacillus ghanensis TaxID=399370 RepID=UPI0039E83EFE